MHQEFKALLEFINQEHPEFLKIDGFFESVQALGTMIGASVKRSANGKKIEREGQDNPNVSITMPDLVGRNGKYVRTFSAVSEVLLGIHPELDGESYAIDSPLWQEFETLVWTVKESVYVYARENEQRSLAQKQAKTLADHLYALTFPPPVRPGHLSRLERLKAVAVVPTHPLDDIFSALAESTELSGSTSSENKDNLFKKLQSFYLNDTTLTEGERAEILESIHPVNQIDRREVLEMLTIGNPPSQEKFAALLKALVVAGYAPAYEKLVPFLGDNREEINYWRGVSVMVHPDSFDSAREVLMQCLTERLMMLSQPTGWKMVERESLSQKIPVELLEKNVVAILDEMRQFSEKEVEAQKILRDALIYSACIAIHTKGDSFDPSIFPLLIEALNHHISSQVSRFSLKYRIFKIEQVIRTQEGEIDCEKMGQMMLDFARYMVQDFLHSLQLEEPFPNVMKKTLGILSYQMLLQVVKVVNMKSERAVENFQSADLMTLHELWTNRYKGQELSSIKARQVSGAQVLAWCREMMAVEVSLGAGTPEPAASSTSASSADATTATAVRLPQQDKGASSGAAAARSRSR